MAARDLGMVTAYAYAVSKGYTGTEEEFATLMASYATVAESAAESAAAAAVDALKSEGFGIGEQNGTPVASNSPYYHNNSKYYSEQASGSAETATAKAGEASQSASDAKGYKNTASDKATEALGSATNAAADALKSEGYALGKQGGTDVESGSPYYQANSKYYKEQAAESALAASGSASNANTDALKAEGFAVGTQGGTAVESDSPYYHNNSKYYEEQAAEVAASIPADYSQLSSDVSLLQNEMNNKANIDGSYEQLTAGNAEQLVSSVGIEDKVPYNFRTSGGAADIGNRETDKIVGGTVAWNQQAYSYLCSAAQETTSGGIVTITPSASGHRYVMRRYGDNSGINVIENHIYIQSVYIKSDGTNEVGFQNYSAGGTLNALKKTKSADWTHLYQMLKCTASGVSYAQLASLNVSEYYIKENSFVLYDLTQMFGSTIANYIYSLETATPGAGVAWFQKLFPKPYYEYNAGELMSVNTSMHRMVGFNQWDEEWESGAISTSTGEPTTSSTTIRSKNFCPCLPNTSYYGCGVNNPSSFAMFFYDANHNYINFLATSLVRNNVFTTPSNARYFKLYFTSTTYNHDICINLSWDGERNGEYEPYKKWEYPLDSSLTLRGIPKLDENNELYYDGDEYESDGTVTRRYVQKTYNAFSGGWGSTNVGYATYITIPDIEPTSGRKYIKCDKLIMADMGYSSMPPYSIGGNSGASTTVTVVLPVSTRDEANQWLANNPITVIYPINTPIIESADEYQNPQIVDDFGTEEYVDYSEAQGTRDVAIPVGHDTFYQSNLKAKLEMAPNSPEGDGDYVVRQSGGENTYVPLVIPKEIPNAPTTDGNYTLRATVSNGTATLTWVAQS